MDGEDADDLTVRELCLDDEEQTKDGCEECADEGCGAADPEDLDACGECSDCTGKS
ncbi:hypothetical protein SAZ11_08375 [Streptomyces sp. FXJ1.4098]|nr:hypothetical protein [Streptomyces sp. FXJ1.4098]